MAGICISLTFLGLALSSPSAELQIVLMNRIMAVIVTLVCAWFISNKLKAATSLQFSAQIMEYMTEGVALASIDTGAILYASPTLEKLFGYLPGELLDKPITVLNASVEIGSQESAIKNFESVKENGFWEGSVQNSKKDGTEFWTKVHVSIFEHSEYGKVAICVLADITDQILANEAKKESESLLEKAQKLTHIGLWRRFPATGEIISSDEFHQITGLSLEADFVEQFVEILHQDDLARVNAAGDKIAIDGVPYDMTFRIIRPDNNELRWLHVIAEAITDKSGNVVEIKGAIQDITKLKRAEEELQKMEKLNSLGILAGGIAHDFNNILTILFGNISLAKNQLPEGHIGLDHLENAEEAFQRASRLTNQLLTFAKGGNPIKKKLSLTKLIKEVASFDLTGSKVKLDFKTDKNLWMVDVDEGQMEQVFSNLIINASQSMPDGGLLHITLENITLKETGPGLSPRNHVRATVRDEGTGISPDQLDQVFDPYFSTKQGGSGLGLATTFSIINKHHGKISVESELGKGATFTLYLPACESQQVPDVAQPLAKSSEKERSGKILVMDDEEMICELAKAVLGSSGYVVDVADGGEQAIGMYKQSIDEGRPYDCIIMDLTIPRGIGGKEAIGEILKINPAAKVIVSSGYADDAVMAYYTDYGFKDVLPKPFSLDTMGEVVNRVLSEE